MSSHRTLMVFTGGGLAPALNATLYGVITEARKKGYRILGAVAGWKGLLPGGRIVDLTALDVESIKDIGGTFLRSSRVNPYTVSGGIQYIKELVAREGISGIIGIGGNDTLGALMRCAQEDGLPVIGIPKTIDNDLWGTYWTPGFPSAAHYISTFVEEIRKDAAYALSRIYVIESLGMHCGWLTASACYGHADIIVPPEKTVSLRRLLDLTKERYDHNGSYAAVVVSQDTLFDEPLEALSDTQADAYGARRKMFIALALRNRIEQELGITTRMLYPGNYFETGAPIPVDRDYAALLGHHAVQLAHEDAYGTMSCLVRPDPHALTLKVQSVPLADATKGGTLRKLEDGMFDFDQFRATPAFHAYLEPALGKFSDAESKYYSLLGTIAKS